MIMPEAVGTFRSERALHIPIHVASSSSLLRLKLPPTGNQAEASYT